MKKHKRSKSGSSKLADLVSLSGLGFSGWAILVLSVAILTLIGSMVISPRKTYRVESSSGTITVQVLNGCGIKGAAESLANALLPGDGSLLYDVIEKADTKLGAFEKTLVIDRRGSRMSPGELSEEAVTVAERLGINEDDIVLLMLEDNILDIDVTLIAGIDYAGFVERLNKTREDRL